ncbi:MAG: PD40 domain-containing protein [Planctomycetes bacterium]|nr:PD40 domain-containing protein [Planctomycetota bacterium]
MKAPRTHWRRAVWRVLGSWYLPAALLTLLLLAAAWYLIPRPTTEVVSVDGQHRWDEDAAPPQRGIVWLPAVPLQPTAAPVPSEASLIRPQLAEAGSVLYFTQQKPTGDADIYRSFLHRGIWQPAEPVEALNTPSDDIGPVVSADGRLAVIYSNRPGGHGGFDIYVSRRTDDGWSEPRNLGAPVNTPAHEYDPALSADGDALFFASNRTEQMQRAAEQWDNDSPSRQWSTTLRAQQGLLQFDLYRARRSDSGDSWESPRPLTAVNRADANEGAPFLSPSGAFLYFASDRPHRGGEARNYDLYRAQVEDDTITDVENLGRGVNTSANETEPALSPEGFRILFSSDRTEPSEQVAGVDQYALYDSTATEIVRQRGWDYSNAQAVAARWWWFVMAALLAALLAALIWYIRAVSLRRATVPGFFLAALILHFLIGAGSFFFYFGEAILAEIRKKPEEGVVATDVLSSTLHQSHEQGEASYEKLADLKAMEKFELAAPQRTVTRTPNMPVPTDLAIPALPVKLTSDLPPELVVPRAPVVKVPLPETLQPTRPRVTLTLPEEKIEIEPVESQPPEPSPSFDRVEPDAPQRQLAMVDAEIPENVPNHQPPPEPIRPSADRAPIDPSQAEPTDKVADTSPTALNRTTPTPLPPVEMPRVKPEPVSSSQGSSPGEPQPPRLEIPVDRRTPIQTADAGALPQPRKPLGDLPAPVFRDLLHESAGEQVALLENPSDLAPPDRPRRAPFDPLSEPEVPREDVPAEPPKSGASNGPAAPEPLKLNVPRQSSPGQPAADLSPPAHSKPVDTPISGPTPEEMTADAATDSPDHAAVNPQPQAMRRTARTPVNTTAINIEPIDVEPLPPAVGNEPAGRPPVDAIAMKVDRSDTTMARFPVAMPDAIGGRHVPENLSLVVGSLARETVDTAPSVNPLASRIIHQRSRAPRVLYAEDAISLQSMLQRRQVDEQTKRDLVQKYGSPKESLEAIHKGLVWIKSHQRDDGRWSLHDFNGQCRGHRCKGHGSSKSDTAGTGLALLPFLGDGHTHKKGDYRSTVDRGLRWLIEHQKDDGDLFTGGEGNAQMYSHAIGTIALCEAYGMSGDASLRGPAQKAINFIVAAQHSEGGWRYRPNEQGDMSVVGWQVMALKSGQIADLEVPQKTFTAVWKFLDHTRSGRSEFGYQDRGRSTPALSAEGLLCMQYLGVRYDDPRLRAGADNLLQRVPAKGKDTSYYWYYGTQVMFHLQGDHWTRWNEAAAQLLVDTQLTEGPSAGTWDPRDNWEGRGGRLYATSLRLLMLEVPYRHLPLYKPLEKE